jgi:hypothetical protein
MKKWKPTPREAVVAFETVTSNLPGAELRRMFGYSWYRISSREKGFLPFQREGK